jgi:hypothetical protein
MTHPVALPHPGHPLIAKKLWKVPVKVLVNDSRLCETIRKVEFWLIAKSAVDAANWVRDRMQYLPETEIWAWGPKGGETYRYVGWETAVAHSIIDRLDADKIYAGMEEVLGEAIDWSLTNAII